MILPAGVEIPFSWVRVRGDRAHVSGHGVLEPSGSPASPFGRVPDQVPLEAAQYSDVLALLALLAILASLKSALGDLDRVSV